MSIIKFFSKQRVFTATIFIAITIGAALLGDWFLTAFLFVLIFVGCSEFIALLNHKKIYPAKELIYPINVIIILLAHFGLPQYFIHVIVFSIILSFTRFVFVRKQVSITDVFATYFIIGYSCLLPVYFILIRKINIEVEGFNTALFSPGAGFLLLTLMCIWTSDIGAYYTGKKLGKRPLCPELSPKKTIEGAIGGSLAGIIMAIIMGFIIQINIVHSILLGIIIVIMAQLGDLCESIIKRDAGVKDSGDIVPGHGGVLDRADSYILTAAASFYYINYVILNGLL